MSPYEKAVQQQKETKDALSKLTEDISKLTQETQRVTSEAEASNDLQNSGIHFLETSGVWTW